MFCTSGRVEFARVHQILFVVLPLTSTSHLLHCIHWLWSRFHFHLVEWRGGALKKVWSLVSLFFEFFFSFFVLPGFLSELAPLQLAV